MVEVADRFRFVGLKEALGEKLSCHISLDTVLLLLFSSEKYHLPELEKMCWKFVEDESNAVRILSSPTFLDLPEHALISLISRDGLIVAEMDIFQAVLRWKERNGKSPEEMAEVVKCIRLSEFSTPNEIFAEVEPTGLFEASSLFSAVRAICSPSANARARTGKPRGRKGRVYEMYIHINIEYGAAQRHWS